MAEPSCISACEGRSEQQRLEWPVRSTAKTSLDAHVRGYRRAVLQRIRAFGCPKKVAAASHTPVITLPTIGTLTRLPQQQRPISSR